MSRVIVIALTSLALLSESFPLAGQQQTIEPNQISQEALSEQILKELRAIREILTKLTPPQGSDHEPTRVRISKLEGYSLGRSDAPVTLIEFTDLQCPFCRQYALTTFDEIKKQWVDTGKLRYIARDFPLDIHAQAWPAARAARCAGEQGRFWDLRLALVRGAHLLTADYINKTASEMNLDPQAFSACIASPKYDAAIRAELNDARALGISGTPTFVVGRTRDGFIEGPVLVGASPYSAFDEILKWALEAK